jgi:hypothetical protein
MSFGVISTWTSFSASTNVSGVTAGPTGAAVPNAGGAPGVLGVCFGSGDSAASFAATAAPIKPIELLVKNSLRDFAILHRLPKLIYCYNPDIPSTAAT